MCVFFLSMIFSFLFSQRDFINAEYEQDASFLSQDTNSLANQSLSSLKSPSENKTDNATKLIFNKQAKNEFLKKQSQTTLHRRSVNNEILHKLTYRNLTATYKNSPNLLTRNKLFCLIYLGLLLIKDRMQLGDLLRLIREGHVSFNAVMHFFPDDLRQQKGVDLSHYLARKMPISHFATRQYTVELAKFIDVTSEIPAQNLVDLCERYCLELNLPRGIFHCALKLMAEAVPSMRVDKKSSVIPNFEGRAMCFLIFTMKLLFGLDDVTEHKFSEFATIINHINKDSKLHIKTMFVFDDWMKHIQCRRFVLKRYHFPTNFADAQNLNNVDLFVEFFQKNLPDLQTDDNEETQRVDYQVFKKLLMELQDENCDDLNLRFRSSLTPFRDYTETILRTHLQFLPNLKHSFTENCMDFLLHPYSYLKLINGNQLLEIKHRGANKVTEFIKIINPRGAQYLQRKNRRDFVAVKLQNKNKNLIKQTNSINMQSIDSGRIIKAHIEQYRGKQKKTISKLKKLSIDELFANKKITHRVEDVYEMHYNPFEMFWISSRHMDRFVAGEERFEDYLQTLPHSFVFLLEECARILEMDQRHLLEEYVTVELYLCHVVKFRRTSVLQPVMDDEVKKLINKAKREW